MSAGPNSFERPEAEKSAHNGSSIYAGYGHALTPQVWYENLLRVEYRYSF